MNEKPKKTLFLPLDVKTPFEDDMEKNDSGYYQYSMSYEKTIQ